MQWRRTGTTLALFLIGLGLLPLGLVAAATLDGAPVLEALGEALPLAGLVLMTCAAALVAAGRTPAMAELRGLSWTFLVAVLAVTLFANSFVLFGDQSALVVGVLLVGGLAVTIVLSMSPSRSRRQPREFTRAFGMILMGGVVLGGLAAVGWGFSESPSVLAAVAVLVGAVDLVFLAAPAALLAAERVAAVAVVRWLATAYLAMVYLLPFVTTWVLGETWTEGLAVWVVGLLVSLVTVATASVAVATLAYDSAMRRRRLRG
ncbi:hypothetical protein [Nocardioides bigeumensis]|uniref:Uncharacterized protein n=1 Tax=Nocardioides bigeumensis TaxID=433657 RepID=A0ABP5K2P8_9ACTN